MPERNDISKVQLDELSQTIEKDILPLAEVMEAAFTRAARTIEEEMAAAAKNGSLSFQAMVEEILEDLARLAAEELIRAPLEQAIGQLISGSSSSSSVLNNTSQSLSTALSASIKRETRNG